MDFPSVINLGASLVTIVGTTLTIAQALRHTPSVLQQNGSAPTGYAPQYPSQGAASHNISPSALQGRRPILRTGVGYGVGLSLALSIVFLTGNWLLEAIGWYQREIDAPNPQGWALVFITLAAMLSLFIAAGLVPARRAGSVAAGLVAGVIVAVTFDVVTAVVGTQTSLSTDLGEEMLYGIIPSLFGFTLSAFFAFVGRWAYRRAASHRNVAMGSSAQ